MTGIETIEHKVRQFGRRQGRLDAAALALVVLAWVVICLAIALVMVRSPFYGLLGLVPLCAFRRRTLLDRARQIEPRLGLNGELVNSLQLSRLPPAGREGYSQDLIQAAIDAAADRVRDLDFIRHLSYDRLRRSFLFFLVAVAIGLLPPALAPGRIWRALHPAISYRLTPETGRYLRGREVSLRLDIFSAVLPGTAMLVAESGGIVTRERLPLKDGTAEKQFTLRDNVNAHFEFFGLRTRTSRLAVIEPLSIVDLSLHLRYPAYTNRAPETQGGRQLIAPVGTEVTIRGRASAALDSARAESRDTVPMNCSEDSFSYRFTLQEEGTCVLHLFAGSDLREPLTLYAVPDLPPLVDLFFPGVDINLPEDMKTAVAVRASDDYGLSRAVFYYSFKTGGNRVLPLKRALEDTVYFTWDLTELDLLPGDEVRYFVRVWDNHGQSTVSKTFTVLFPTMEQIYDALRDREDSIRQDLADLQSEHQESREEIERLQEKIARERDLSWRDQEQLKEIIRTETDIARKIDQWQQELEKAVEELNQGLVLDPEAINRLQEIARILQEIAPEELKKALAELQSRLDNKDPEDIARSLENLKKNQDELAKALARTLEILKRFQQEERLKELASNARDLARDEDRLDAKGLSPDTACVSDSIAALNARIDSLANAIRDLARSQGLEPEISQPLDSLQQQTRDLAADGSSAPRDKAAELEKLASNLERLYEEMTKGRTANLRQHLMETMNQLIDLSQAIESSVREGNRDPGFKEELIKAARTVADSLYGQQVKSLYVTPGMGKKLGRAINEMSQAAQQNRGGQSGAGHETEAMRQINLTTLEIMENMKKAGAGGSSTGMDELLQQLSSIGQGQMSLNQSLMGLFPLPGGLTPGAMSALRRLAGRQRELREALQALNGEPGASRYQDLIDNLTREMEKAEEQLYQYKLDRTLIERQKMIISRLLDAQRSIRQEDFQKERKSKPGHNEGRIVTSPLPEDLGRDELRELIQQALREPYPKDYELLIREYFKALIEETRP